MALGGRIVYIGETWGYQYAAPKELFLPTQSSYRFHLPQSLFVWARWEDIPKAFGTGLRPASAVGALLCLDFLVLLGQAKRMNKKNKIRFHPPA